MLRESFQLAAPRKVHSPAGIVTTTEDLVREPRAAARRLNHGIYHGVFSDKACVL